MEMSEILLNLVKINMITIAQVAIMWYGTLHCILSIDKLVNSSRHLDKGNNTKKKKSKKERKYIDTILVKEIQDQSVMKNLKVQKYLQKICLKRDAT